MPYSPSSGKWRVTVDAAARAERQAVEAVVLRQRRPSIVTGIDVGGIVAIADRQAADLLRRRQIALEQRRRDLQHVGDVVEAVARIVGRQQRRDVDVGDVERQQVAHGVLVFGAVQPVERPVPPGFGCSRARAIERASRARSRQRRTSRASGRGAPAGGIDPVRSFLTTFSQVSLFDAG